MFKKSVSVQTTRPLSGKDAKALRRSVQLQFPDANEDEVAQLLPAKAEIALLKLSNRAACYTVNGGSPLFFDPDGRGDILAPTVYALWLCPQLLPPVFTYSEVSPKARRRRPAHGRMTRCRLAVPIRGAGTVRALAAQAAGGMATCVHRAGLRAKPRAGRGTTQYAAGAQVLGGADLFLQGFIVDGPAALGDFAAGDLRCVRIPQNAFPFAVGTLEVRARGPLPRMRACSRRRRSAATRAAGRRSAARTWRGRASEARA